MPTHSYGSIFFKKHEEKKQARFLRTGAAICYSQHDKMQQFLQSWYSQHDKHALQYSCNKLEKVKQMERPQNNPQDLKLQTKEKSIKELFFLTKSWRQELLNPKPNNCLRSSGATDMIGTNHMAMMGKEPRHTHQSRKSWAEPWRWWRSCFTFNWLQNLLVVDESWSFKVTMANKKSSFG